MTGHDGNATPPAPLCAGTGPMGISSAVSSGAGANHGRRSTKRGKEPASAGSCSPAARVGSPPPPSKRLKSREAESVGGAEKRRTAVLDDKSGLWSCGVCHRKFHREKGVHGHMRVHSEQREQQGKSGALDDGPQSFECKKCKETFRSQAALNGHQNKHARELKQLQQQEEAKRKEIHNKLDLNKAPEDDGNGDASAPISEALGKMKLSKTEDWEMKGDGSALAEGGPSSSEEVEKAKRKETHKKLDLNKPPECDGNGDEESA
ncbi:hypothetical protein BT93_B0216 [Corymbia citriodora subsp. variegata]|nr:hypothetical protein BT93_B0216 [Corymbia citriodora subsp. variegata]